MPDLAAELLEYAGKHCDVKPTYEQVVELLKIQLGAAKELAPYLHQKQPMAIQGAENGLVNLFIGDVPQAQIRTSEAADLTLDIIDVESEQKQGVSDDENLNSDVLDSDVLSQSIESKEKIQGRDTD